MAVTREQVAEIYVATFDRAPDSAGLDYWEGTDLSIEEIAQSFFEQDETQEKYPDTLSNALFVDEIYNNVYNHSGDPEGAAYWITELDNGTPRNVMIIAMVNGAQGTDQDTLDNKVEVGLYFADNGTLLSYDQSIEVMEGVTSDDATVESAIAEVDAWSAAVQTIPLTIEIDAIVGTDLDNTITALVAADPSDTTLNPEDTIDGGGSDNRLALTNEAVVETTTLLSHMSSVATLAYTNSATLDQTIDTAGTTGVQTIEMHGEGSDKTSFINVVNIVNLELNGASATTEIVYTAAAVVSDDNNMNIINSSTEAQTVNLEGIETIHLTSGTDAGVVNTVDLFDPDLSEIFVNGEGAMTILDSVGSGSDVATIDLSAATGNITVESSIVGFSGASITSGKGQDTINLGAGDDTVIYTLAEQSHFVNSDMLVGFVAADDTVNLTAAIDAAALGNSTSRAVTAAEFTDHGAVLAEDAEMTTVTKGLGDTYYIDVDMDSEYNAAIDMMITFDAGTVLTEADFIV